MHSTPSGIGPLTEATGEKAKYYKMLVRRGMMMMMMMMVTMWME
jgi:hypothetical protein